MAYIATSTTNCLAILNTDNNSHDLQKEEIKALGLEKSHHQIVINESKQEYDLKQTDVNEIEKMTSSKIICNIGYGGFSTVKLIYNHQQKTYYALKVVNNIK
jgi:hypothetical protein